MSTISNDAVKATFAAFCEELGVSDRKIYRPVMSKQMFYAVLKGDRFLSSVLFMGLVNRLQDLLDEWASKEFKQTAEGHSGGARIDGWHAIRRRIEPVAKPLMERVLFVRLEQSGRLVIDPSWLSVLTSPSRVRQTESHDASPAPPGGNRQATVLRIPDDMLALPDEELGKWVKGVAARAGLQGPIRLEASLPDGCTEIVLELTTDDAERLKAAFARGDLSDFGVVGVYGIDRRVTDLSDRPMSAATPRIALDAPDADDLMVSSARQVLRRARVFRPWRLLRWLLSPRLSRGGPSHRILESDASAYATSASAMERSSLKADLVTAWMTWPIMTATLLALSLVTLRLFDPSVLVGVGLLTGLILSLLGGQVCATVISPLAVGAASIVLGWAFGVVNGVVGRFVTGFTAESVRGDPFLAVTGGIAGLSAPEWPVELGWPATATLLIVLLLGITLAGWLMAQPYAVGLQRKVTPVQQLTATGCGVLMGANIPLVLALTRSLELLDLEPPSAFAAAFTIVGACTFAFSVWLKSRRLRTVIVCALCHGLISLALCSAVFYTSAYLPLTLTAANAWYHATWFTAAFVVARTIGSRHAAIAAGAIEGAGGFGGFLAWRILSG